eukprot:713985-Pyramimonas_sp.AAC.2
MHRPQRKADYHRHREVLARLGDRGYSLKDAAVLRGTVLSSNQLIKGGTWYLQSLTLFAPRCHLDTQTAGRTLTYPYPIHIHNTLDLCGAELDHSFKAGALANEDQPAAVRDVHVEYLQAGADVITTNTFVLTPYHMESCGRTEKLVHLLQVGPHQFASQTFMFPSFHNPHCDKSHRNACAWCSDAASVSTSQRGSSTSRPSRGTSSGQSTSSQGLVHSPPPHPPPPKVLRVLQKKAGYCAL